MTGGRLPLTRVVPSGYNLIVINGPGGSDHRFDINYKRGTNYMPGAYKNLRFTAKGHISRRIDRLVVKARDNEEWKVEYMTLEMRDRENIEKGREEGIIEGREELRSEAVIEAIRAGLDEDLILRIFKITDEKYEEYRKHAE